MRRSKAACPFHTAVTLAAFVVTPGLFFGLGSFLNWVLP